MWPGKTFLVSAVPWTGNLKTAKPGNHYLAARLFKKISMIFIPMVQQFRFFTYPPFSYNNIE